MSNSGWTTVYMSNPGYDWFEPPPDARDEIERDELKAKKRKSKMKPVTPSEAEKLKPAKIPDAVIEAFNEVITKKYNIRAGTSSFTQDEVLTVICKKTECDKEDIFQWGWLDIEPIFEKAGWTVTYDKPGYNETGPAVFNFKKK